MKIQLTLSLTAVLAFAGCSNDGQPFSIARFVPLEGDCTLPESDTVLAGSAQVDVAAGAPEVTVGIVVEGKGYDNNGLTLRTGEVLEPADNNYATLKRMQVTYRLSRRLGPAPKPYLVPMHLQLRGSGGGGIVTGFGPFQLISPELSDLLFNGLTASTTLDDFVDIEADVSFTGDLNVSGSPVQTGVATFPIRAVRSAPTVTCPAPQVYKRFLTTLGNGDPNFCQYVGTSTWKFGTRPPPSVCCTPGTDPGC